MDDEYLTRCVVDPIKRKLYTESELLYMEKQLVLLKELRKTRVQQRKLSKGFGNE